MPKPNTNPNATTVNPFLNGSTPVPTTGTESPQHANLQAYENPAVTMHLFRNDLSDTETTTLSNGTVVPAWIPDPKNPDQFVQDKVNHLEAQVGDNVIITNLGHYLKNPTVFKAKLDKASEVLPEGLRIAPIKEAPMYAQLGFRAFINDKGTYIGWVAEDNGGMTL